MSPRKEVAVVIGASRGIGRQVAIDLAKNGYKGIYEISRIEGSSNSDAWASGRCSKVFERCS